MKGDRKYLVFALVGLTLLSVFFYHFIHLEKELEIRDFENKIAQNKKDIDAIKKFNNTHKNIDEEMSILAKRHFRIIEAFPTNLNEEHIVEYLSEAAGDYNLKILLLNSDEVKEDENKKSFIKVFHLKLQGDYFNILDFLYELNNSNKFFDVKRFYIKSDNGILTLDMDINCYFSDNKTR